MKKLLSTLVLLLVISLGNVFAQSTADVIAKANVLAELSITKQSDIDFGNVSQGYTYTIQSSDPRSAKVLVEGGDGNTVNVDFPTSITMTGQNNGDSMAFNTETPLHNNIDDKSTASTFGSTSGGTFTFDGSQEYIYIGGSINTTGVTSDQYTGTLTITVNYN